MALFFNTANILLSTTFLPSISLCFRQKWMTSLLCMEQLNFLPTSSAHCPALPSKNMGGETSSLYSDSIPGILNKEQRGATSEVKLSKPSLWAFWSSAWYGNASDFQLEEDLGWAVAQWAKPALWRISCIALALLWRCSVGTHHSQQVCALLISKPLIFIFLLRRNAQRKPPALDWEVRFFIAREIKANLFFFWYHWLGILLLNFCKHRTWSSQRRPASCRIHTVQVLIKKNLYVFRNFNHYLCFFLSRFFFQMIKLLP